MTSQQRIQLRSLCRESVERFGKRKRQVGVIEIEIADLMLFVESAEFFFDKTDKGEVVKRRERLFGLCVELDREMDGVSPIPASAAACLNGIRSIIVEEQ